MKLDEDKRTDLSIVVKNLRDKREDTLRKRKISKGSGGMDICRDVEALLDTDPLILYKKSFGPNGDVHR